MTPKEQTPDAQTYKCEDCGTDINEGEFKTFGICDDCWDKHHKKVQPPNSNEDEGFKKLVIDTFHELYPYSSGPHLNELFILAERISKYERAKQAELVEEHKNFKAAIADTILEIENKFHAEQAENERLRGYITAEREISQRFSDENARLRQALEEIQKYYDIAESNDDFASETMTTIRAALTKTPKP